MKKEQVLTRAKETLAPLETENIVNFVQNLTVQTFIDNPLLIVLFLVVLFYAVVRRSRFLLLFLFSFLSLLLLVRHTLPAGGEELTARAMLPFAAGSLLIGAVIIYFTFVKSE